MKKLDQMTYKELKDEMIKNGITLICNKSLIWHQTKHKDGEYLESEHHVVRAEFDLDRMEGEMFIEGYIKRIPKDLVF